LSKLPGDEQRKAVLDLLATGDREEVLLDVFWALLNSKEFTFNR
jgi:hypothetical protein